MGERSHQARGPLRPRDRLAHPAPVAELFQTTVPNISMHLRNAFAEGEPRPEATVKNFLTVRREGARQVSRNLECYNLDAIISVGYRVKSGVATQFRIWATQRLREYIVKGFALDDERLKNPDVPFDYFEELTFNRRCWRSSNSGRRVSAPEMWSRCLALRWTRSCRLRL